MTTDPISDPSRRYSPAGLNRYVYCVNRPLYYTDPTGCDIWSDLLIGAGLDILSGGAISSAAIFAAATLSTTAVTAAVTAVSSTWVTSVGPDQQTGGWDAGVSILGLVGTNIEFYQGNAYANYIFYGAQMPGTSLGVGYDYQYGSWYDQEEASGSVNLGTSPLNIFGDYSHKEYWNTGEEWINNTQGIGFGYGTGFKIGADVSVRQSWYSSGYGNRLTLQDMVLGFGADVGIGNVNLGLSTNLYYNGYGQYEGADIGLMVGFNQSNGGAAAQGGSAGMGVSGGLGLNLYLNQYNQISGITGTINAGFETKYYAGGNISMTAGYENGMAVFDWQGGLTYDTLSATKAWFNNMEASKKAGAIKMAQHYQDLLNTVASAGIAEGAEIINEYKLALASAYASEYAYGKAEMRLGQKGSEYILDQNSRDALLDAGVIVSGVNYNVVKVDASQELKDAVGKDFSWGNDLKCFKSENGMSASIFAYTDPDTGKTTYIIAFTGYPVNQGKGILTNGVVNAIAQEFGRPAPQFQDAINFAISIKKYSGFGNDIVFTGQSLGGGLASAAGLATRTKTITFDAEGLNPSTMAGRLGNLDEVSLQAEAMKYITAYDVRGEALWEYQDNIEFLPIAVGNRITIDCVAPPTLDSVGQNGMWLFPVLSEWYIHTPLQDVLSMEEFLKQKGIK